MRNWLKNGNDVIANESCPGFITSFIEIKPLRHSTLSTVSVLMKFSRANGALRNFGKTFFI